MKLELEAAGESDAGEVYALKRAVAEDLTARFGKGPWSPYGTLRGTATNVRTPTLWIARREGRLAAMLRLATRKPWAIDTKYFSAARSPLYLTDMAVAPDLQRMGIGRACLVEAERIALESAADAIRLDAYDADAGAGGFYARCGYRDVGRASFRKTPLVYFERILSA
jgi:ribosomal protein S18 acetylase RimI-like enzyme